MKKIIKVLCLIVSFSFPAMAVDSFNHANTELRLINIDDIINRLGQNVAFKGNDGCNYYGSTEYIDKIGGILLSTRLCSSLRQEIKARAYMIQLKRQKTPIALIPAGSVWELKQDWTSK
ncbi:hypothetical protein DMO59_22915 [Salmonella enterica subsp. diarizonae]|uniref:Uncharacterized protein n=1 Tax=Salmonella enterica TaxID=28901 RepID=A0A743Z9F3_SALER|nr:hypothetical protein [Salmonella enterica subsp. enterica]EBU7689406.1 hypothetical protein [Salmonella enterica subsp. enterica serovar Oranienburg]EBY9433101.1 hypothetical protein [Salmonella enterica subsp. enterica serovar Cerro]ECJ4483807.1 hypothetical protein [Salmonella enterica subsp. diarizonae]EEF7431564.1 hypothetical protein [Salmonella enterica subsp. enterica serovar Java]EIJ6452414.1 hypothetical protein [Salmonella enterica]HBM0024173.1 hypothetical protein [Salmonella en